MKNGSNHSFVKTLETKRERYVPELDINIQPELENNNLNEQQ